MYLTCSSCCMCSQPRILGPLKAKNGESLTSENCRPVVTPELFRIFMHALLLQLTHRPQSEEGAAADAEAAAQHGEGGRDLAPPRNHPAPHHARREGVGKGPCTQGRAGVCAHVLCTLLMRISSREQSLEPYLPETEEVKAEKLMLSLILARSRARVRFVPLSSIPRPPLRLTGLETPEQRETRLLLHRLEILWEILNPPDAVKLEFKFIIKVRVSLMNLLLLASFIYRRLCSK